MSSVSLHWETQCRHTRPGREMETEILHPEKAILSPTPRADCCGTGVTLSLCCCNKIGENLWRLRLLVVEMPANEADAMNNNAGILPSITRFNRVPVYLVLN